MKSRGFPGGSMVKHPLAVQETQVQSLGLERSPGGGNGIPLQYSFLKNPMDTEVWQAIGHGATNNQTRLSDSTRTFHSFISTNVSEDPRLTKHCTVWATWRPPRFYIPQSREVNHNQILKNTKKNELKPRSPGIPWQPSLPLQSAQVPSLAGEQRPCKPPSMTKQTKYSP